MPKTVKIGIFCEKNNIFLKIMVLTFGYTGPKYIIPWDKNLNETLNDRI